MVRLRENDRDTVGYAIFGRMVEENGQRRVGRPNTPLPKFGVPMWKEQTAGARIVLRMSELASPAEVEHVLAHEMAHAVGPHLMRWATTDQPASNEATWAVEGFASWVEHLSDRGSAAKSHNLVRQNRAKLPGVLGSVQGGCIRGITVGGYGAVSK